MPPDNSGQLWLVTCPYSVLWACAPVFKCGLYIDSGLEYIGINMASQNKICGLVIYICGVIYGHLQHLFNGFTLKCVVSYLYMWWIPPNLVEMFGIYVFIWTQCI